MENIIKILKLSEKRINHLHNIDNCGWYEGYNTYIKGIKSELDETIDEIKENNSVYLEDELGDIFWCYICLLNSLEQDKLIDKEKVFERCYKKFQERLGESPEFEHVNWKETKEKQKVKLEVEHKEKYNMTK